MHTYKLCLLHLHLLHLLHLYVLYLLELLLRWHRARTLRRFSDPRIAATHMRRKRVRALAPPHGGARVPWRREGVGGGSKRHESYERSNSWDEITCSSHMPVW